MARRLKITLAARAVVAKGYEFSPRGGSFADAGVARDEILSLPPPSEPLVLRVVAKGGGAAERELVAGDWLCDTTLGEPRRIPPPAWVYSYSAAAWVKKRSWLEAWETCEDARWLLHAAPSVGVDRRLVARAACACARTALDRVPAGEERPRRAIETAEAWARGEATLDQARQDASAASAAASAAAASGAANAADAATAAAYAAYTAYAAFYAATAASYVASGAAERRRTLARLAELVRGEIPTWVVLRSASEST